MWIVELVCSDPACAEEREALVGDLEELDELVCDCDCTLVTLAVANFEPLELAGRLSNPALPKQDHAAA